MRLAKLIPIFITLIFSGRVRAEEIAPFEETALFQLGYFLPEFGSDLRVDNLTLGRGTEIHLEDRLGLNKQLSLIWGSASWRFFPNHRVQLGFFEFNRHGDRQIDREIQIGDKVFPVGASLTSSLKFTVIPINYLYSFIRTSDLEFSGLIGLQWSRISYNIAGSITTNPADIDKTTTSSTDAPLPVLGVDLNYYITPQWNVAGTLGAFIYKVKTPDTTTQGTVATATVSGGYWFSNYVGVGAAINWFSINVDIADPRWEGKFNYQYWGPQLYLTGRF